MSVSYVTVTGVDSSSLLVVQKLDLGIDCDSRIALVGPNGAGDDAPLLAFEIGLLAHLAAICILRVLRI